MDSQKTPELLLETWFGEINSEGIPTEVHKINRWFDSTPEFDQQLHWLFEKDLQILSHAKNKMVSLWQSSPEHWLAYIILTDQVPRYIYRGQAQALAFDAMALKACEWGLEKGIEKELTPCQKAFFYLPLGHSESEAHQSLSVEKFSALENMAQGELLSLLQPFLVTAKTNQRIIRQFKRFPHRNSLLGRENTPAEKWFLDTTQSKAKQRKPYVPS